MPDTVDTPAEDAKDGDETIELPAVDAALLEMPLSEFAESGLCREVYSKVLGERVIFAADNAEVPDDTALAVYQASELQLLDGASPDVLRAVHQVREIFDGQVVEVDSPDDQVIPSEALWGPQACCACGQRKWWRKQASVGRPVA